MKDGIGKSALDVHLLTHIAVSRCLDLHAVVLRFPKLGGRRLHVP
jgi:hypothetical protein